MQQAVYMLPISACDWLYIGYTICYTDKIKVLFKDALHIEFEMNSCIALQWMLS